MTFTSMAEKRRHDEFERRCKARKALHEKEGEMSDQICKLCDGPLMILGQLGGLTHFRCRDCGMVATSFPIVRSEVIVYTPELEAEDDKPFRSEFNQKMDDYKEFQH